MTETRKVWLLIGLLGALWIAFWWPKLGGAELLFARDLNLLAETGKAWGMRQWMSGVVPSWAPWVGTGLPFLADPANQAFYPVNLLYMIAPTAAHATTWFALAHLGGGVLGVFALARALNLVPVAAFGGACAYGLSGYVLSITDNLTYVPAVLWVPVALTCWLNYLAASQRVVRWAWLAGVSGALGALILAGDPLHGPITLIMCWFLGWPRGRYRSNDPTGTTLRLAAMAWPATWRATWRVGAAGAGAVCVGAAQLLPSFSLLSDSARGAGISFADATAWSLPPARLFEFIHPWLFGSAYPAFEFLGARAYGGLSAPWASSVHIGVFVCVCALFAWPSIAQRTHGARTFAACAVLSAVAALGAHLPGSESIHALLGSLLAQRYPEKLVYFTTLAVCVLAAIGLHRLTARGRADGSEDEGVNAAEAGPSFGAGASRHYLHRPVTWLAFSAIVPVSAFVGLSLLPEPDIASGTSVLMSSLVGVNVTHGGGVLVHAVVVALLVLVLGVLYMRSRALVAPLLVVAILCDGFWVHRAFPPAGPADVLLAAPGEALAGILRQSGSISTPTSALASATTSATTSDSLKTPRTPDQPARDRPDVQPRLFFTTGASEGYVPFSDGGMAQLVSAGLAQTVGPARSDIVAAGYAPLYVAVYQRARLHPLRGLSHDIAYLNAEPSPLVPAALEALQQTLATSPSRQALETLGVSHVLALPQDKTRWREAGLAEIPVPTELNLSIWKVPSPRQTAWFAHCGPDCDLAVSSISPGHYRIELADGGRLLTRVSALPGWQAFVDGQPVSVDTHAGEPRADVPGDAQKRGTSPGPGFVLAAAGAGCPYGRQNGGVALCAARYVARRGVEHTRARGPCAAGFSGLYSTVPAVKGDKESVGGSA